MPDVDMVQSMSIKKDIFFVIDTFNKCIISCKQQVWCKFNNTPYRFSTLYNILLVGYYLIVA
ncbi:hypothetical protein DLR65_01720 [Vibrio tarriae]|nr:hypothetical protein DLR59_12910 [Vibrio tarriae]RBM33078.1 hypothetical protein DLR63_18995 [Vibrio tarriae]RBM44563.1 hypothetical protein DLR64_18820 [Vibrio tarriae]RBM52407.1 hypothetical protein DLR65_01720 [Vibrio tarriae]